MYCQVIRFNNSNIFEIILIFVIIIVPWPNISIISGKIYNATVEIEIEIEEYELIKLTFFFTSLLIKFFYDFKFYCKQVFIKSW